MTEETRLAYSANHVYREGYEQGKVDTIESLIELVNSDGFKMRCLMTNLPFFEFVAKEFEQVLKEQNNG